jgi:hypothetical protein
MQQGLVGPFVALFGPLFGFYAMIVFCALAGSLWPLSNRNGDSGNSALFVLRLVLTATVLTSVIALYVESQWGYRSNLGAAPIAFAIGAIGDNWLVFINKVVERVGALVDRFSGTKNEPKP